MKGGTMKTVRALGWILSGIAVAAGCIGFEHVPKTDHASAFLSVSNGPREASWTRNFNPLLPSALFPSAGGIYEPLLVYNRVKGNYVPWLATSYTWSADNTKLTFAIRSGVKWSDGRPFTARDVAFTFELLRRQKALDARAVWEFLSEVQAIGDSTF